MNPSLLRKLILPLSVLPLLSGCGSESASYRMGPERALTLIQEKAYPWSRGHQRYMVVMAKPRCIVRYRLPPDPGGSLRLEVFREDEDTYVMRDAAGQYRATLADCQMSWEGGEAGTPGEFKGAFEPAPGGGIRFVPSAAER
jgi:hypothetical protein